MFSRGPLYTIEKDHEHGNVESPQNISKGHLMEIQKSFMSGPRFSSVT
jgi:hypothetical protein